MKGKLHCCLQDMGTLRGNLDKGAAKKSKPWVQRKDNETRCAALMKVGGAELLSCVLGVYALG